jgi:GTP-binding protein YchF
MKVGIVGFQGSGKSAIFNALTGLSVQTGAHAERKKPHLGVIKVPDQRVETLGGMLKRKKMTHAEIIFMDFAPGKGEKALDPNMLQQMKEADSLAQVVRCFADPLSAGPPFPMKEIRDFDAELKLTDLEIIENRLVRLKKEKDTGRERELLERSKAFIEEEKPLRLLSLSDEENRSLSGFGFLSQKPLLILINLGEEDIGKPLSEELTDYMTKEGLQSVPMCGKVEMELVELEEKERLEFLKEMGLAESAKDRFIRSSYSLMALISFLTHNEEEVRAWSIRRGTPALKAAGKVHSDMERGFIRAEVVHYDEFVKYGSEAKCKEAGRLRLEGKEYIVRDGDIIRFRFHV